MSKQETDRILEVNELFYKALGNRDLNLMKQVWVKDQKAGCVHPGWTILRSWDAIMQSWENIFDPLDQVDITLSDIMVSIKKKTAWVTCIQRMTYINRHPVSYNLSQSTNIFEKSNGDWKMVIHHASILPVEQDTPQRKNLQ